MRLSPSWLTMPETRRLLRVLEDVAAAPRFVGGCVRDAVLGLTAADIDLATPLPPDRLLPALRAAGLRAYTPGLRHGVVGVAIDGKSFQIATLRRDVATDGRHARVAYTDDWRTDAARRDFTINALYMSPDGAVSDFFDGLADIRAGRVRFIGDPAQRLAEDRLRLLRFYRFHAFYGRTDADPAARRACARVAPELPELAAERRGAEFMKLLAATDPAAVLQMMHEDGALKFLSDAGPLPVVAPGETVGETAEDIFSALSRLSGLEAALDAPHALRRLALLLSAAGPAARLDHARALRLPADAARRVQALAVTAPGDGVAGDGAAAAFFHFYDAAGPDAVIDLSLLSLALQRPGPWRQNIAFARRIGRPDFPLRGEDVLHCGVAPGAAVGDMLRAVRREWAARGFAPDRGECLRLLKDALQRRSDVSCGAPENG